MENTTIYIVDDNPQFRQSTEWWLESAGYSVKSFSTASVALDQLSDADHTLRSCILMDVRMPKMSGLDLHDKLNENGVKIPVIYMTGHADVSLAVEAMKKGAVTYLEKPLNGIALEDALSNAFSRHAFNDQNNIDAQQQNQRYRQRYKLLTPRETEVLSGVVEGKMNKVIAYDLGISIKTIEIHRSQVRKKMQAKSTADLIKMVLKEKV